jgi:hypothetical protein
MWRSKFMNDTDIMVFFVRIIPKNTSCISHGIMQSVLSLLRFNDIP